MLNVDPRLPDLYTEIGQTLWFIQELEQTLVVIIAIISKVPRGTAREEADTILTKIKKSTLGRLVRDLKEVVDMDNGFESKLSDFVEERNWLAHRLVDNHRSDPMHPQKMDILLVRINDLGENARIINKILLDYLTQYTAAKGIDPNIVAAKAAETVNKWQNQT